MDSKPEITMTPDGSNTNAVIKPEEKKKKKINNGWTSEQEELMANWSDIASCYRLLHDKSEKRFSRFNMAITVPVIMLSTMTGTANFGMGSIFPESFTKANLIIGSFSLIVTLISAISNFLRYAENSEAHKIASVQWAKFQRNITTEISLSPSERSPASEFINLSRKELDRLMEQSPVVDDNIIRRFNKKYPDKKIDFKKPVVFGSIEHTRVYVRNLSMNDFVEQGFKNDRNVSLRPSNNSLHNLKIIEDDFLSEDSRD
jgi:hypothetical protein